MNRTPRKVEIADPLWTALETMSREMGVDRDVLVNQAVFSLARQFGFIQPTQVSLAEAVAAPAVVAVAAPAVVVAVAPPELTVAKAPVETKTEPSDATPSVEVAERVREIVREVEQKVEPRTAPPAVELADTEEDESKTGEHEGSPDADEALASDAAPEEKAAVAEAPVDVEALREAVGARVRDLVRDVDQWVEPVEAKPEEDSDDEDSDDDADDEDSDEEDSDEGAEESDEDSDDDADDEDSDDEDSDDDADEEDSDDTDSGKDADDSDEDAEGDESGAEDADEEDAAASGPALADDDSADLVTQAKDERKTGAAVKPDKTIIVQAPPELKVHVKLDEGEPVLVARERFIIGRGPSADLMVKSARVSREHAVIQRDGDEVFIEDLKSSNGTWFDNTRITRRQVADGEEYLLGGIRITFSLTT
ncbi:FHA domain-containing protein [Myxococcus llanfairpwllgwyngyllgogerychwyrndrobwllllantysiliogogogochensis]|uniref:FHA domain-containing protein n=1 Tax=Myxococcus llanfairpwllgwyngyllgogerychwyrndrobwllllantysiliogogogochensis TaxID=2590453 RepID=A0A540WJN8_9BACT|nr:FHA domain-containing protein [Myxococcus llanfairpwllgwyngyllgogerychwyrndrobwllllantysiliogogogochensis]TQF09239.1 FHA domain-containing protein [Myxococcus llanfairpwllgwyngyllgogerychwyrndrobwllllantysiliogogogochensis]